jgi:hypothetical protein
MSYPVRTIQSWSEQPNPEPIMVERFPTVWIALMSCGHRINFGGGKQPTITQVRCVHCKPLEGEVA